MLVKLIRKLCNKRWQDNEEMIVYYMFYPENSEVVTKTFLTKFIYEEKDIDQV